MINYKNKIISNNIIIIISFTLFSIFNVLIIWHFNILNGNDLYFNLERLEELVKSNTFLPQYAFNSFKDNGSAVMSMYPYLLLYPFALLIKFTRHLVQYVYAIFILNSFFSLIISYYSSLKLNKRITSYFFAVMYTLSYEFIALNFWSCDIGMSFSATFMPLVLFGFIYWLKYNKWIMLSIGIILIIYSNVTVAFFTPILLFIWLLYNYYLIDKDHIKSLIKSIILTLMITSIFWVPFITLFIQNKFTGVGNINGNLGEVSYKSIIATLIPSKSFKFNGWFPWELTIYSFIGIIIGITYFRKLDHITKQCYLLSIFILILSSSFIIWKLPIIKNVGGILQSTIRMYLIPQVLLTYIFARYLGKKLQKIQPNRIKMLFSVFIILFIIIIQLFYGAIFCSQQNSINNHRNGTFRIYHLNSMDNIYRNYPDYYLGSHESIKNIQNGNGIAIYKSTHKKIMRFHLLGHGNLKFYNKEFIDKLTTPLLHYHGEHLCIYMNHRLIHYHTNDNGLITLNNIYKGYNKLKIKYIPNIWLEVLEFILLIIGISWIILICIKKLLNKKFRALH